MKPKASFLIPKENTTLFIKTANAIFNSLSHLTNLRVREVSSGPFRGRIYIYADESKEEIIKAVIRVAPNAVFDTGYTFEQ